MDIAEIMKKILLIFGTRPEAIKMCPLILELRTRKEIEAIICVTGQHREMLNQVMSVFQVVPDYDLAIMTKGQTLFDITIGVLQKLQPILGKEKPDLVMVHGDTTTSFAASLASFYQQIPVAHVEAGLRTYNIASPYPEEFNRQAVSLIANYHFAPTEWAKKNLLAEGKNEKQIYITGNTVIDSLKTTVRKDYWHEELEWSANAKLILLTAHRRENIGEHMHEMFEAVRKCVDTYPDVKVIYPIHLNPSVRKIANEHFKDCDRIHLIEPLDVVDFHNFMKRSYLILTDSGGIQEEASALGKPVLVMRDTTERPEGVEAGILRLVGTSKENIFIALKELLTDYKAYGKMSRALNVYGNGTASKRIADIICGSECSLLSK